MNLELKPTREPTVTEMVAALVFIILSMAIWIPIGYIFALVNLKVTILIFVMSFVINVCKMYLGVK